jgi:hypothetical protein
VSSAPNTLFAFAIKANCIAESIFRASPVEIIVSLGARAAPPHSKRGCPCGLF